ncbi:MAG: hypothetical protein AAGL98_00265 [Planctomycetota bacterium]
MKLCFDSIEEVKAFVGELKGTRGGRKGGSDDGEAQPQAGQAPAPLNPPQGGPQAAMQPQQTTQFNPGAGFPGAAGASAGFLGAGAPGIDPNVQAVVQRIIVAMDGAIAKGQPAAAVLQWFQGEGVKAGVAEAQNATLDQIKGIVLPKMGLPALENIAKLMNA